MEFGSLQWIVEALERFFSKLSARKGKLEQDEQRAVDAFLLALNETMLFLGRPAHKHPEWTPQQEQKLSRHWLAAATAVRAIDPELSGRCQMKAEYWADPTTWSQEDLKRARILISQVKHEATRLILDPYAS